MTIMKLMTADDDNNDTASESMEAVYSHGMALVRTTSDTVLIAQTITGDAATGDGVAHVASLPTSSITNAADAVCIYIYGYKLQYSTFGILAQSDDYYKT